MHITFLTRKSALIYRRGLRQRVASLNLNCNGDFAIRAYGRVYVSQRVAPRVYHVTWQIPPLVYHYGIWQMSPLVYCMIQSTTGILCCMGTSTTDTCPTTFYMAPLYVTLQNTNVVLKKSQNRVKREIETFDYHARHSGLLVTGHFG